MFSFITITYGQSIYFLIPLALIGYNLGLLLTVFIIVLVLFIVGLSILSVNF